MCRRAGYLVLAAVLLCASGVSWGQKKASSPVPADGATDVIMGVLQWTAGSTAVFHTVYLGTTPELGPADIVAPRLPLGVTVYFHMAGIVPGTTYYWRVDETEKDMVTVIQGDVWTFTAWPTWAFLPDPVDGSNAARVAPDLKWVVGQGAQKHHVYFSDNKAAVTDATADADKGEVVEPNYAPGVLQPTTTYFWRVDTIDAAGTLVPGAVWSFTTVSPIDDFESYTNEVGQRVFQTWIDGWGYSEPAPGNPGNGTGASIGHDIWAAGTKFTTIAETSVIHGGLQSMPFDFNNLVEPFYSETDRSWSAAEDWTVGGLDTLVLHIRGQAASLAILPVTTPPAIDATVDDLWTQASIQPMKIRIEGVDVTGTADFSGQFRAVYDATNLYALVDINDSELRNDSSSAYLDDSVEFYVDGENDKGPSPLSGNNRQYTFGWTATDIQGTNTALTGVESAQTNTPTGWRIELKFPWQSLRNAGAPVNKFIGIDCFYNDDDDGGDTRESQIAWNSTSGGDWQTPSSWGTALIAPPQSGAAADRLYVALQDSANHTAVIVHPDPAIVSTKQWTEWTIPLSEFSNANVNLAAVRKMIIGVGDRANPAKGNVGSLFIDDIFLTRPAPPKE